MTRAARALAPGMLVVVPAATAVWRGCDRASWSTIGRDQGIFQYIAWAVSQGDVLYRDVRDVNGPLVAMVHGVLLALGGADEHRFRVLDLVITALVAGFAGGCLVALDRTPARGGDRVLRELSLGAAAMVVLVSQYLSYGWWDTAQRESFFDWFVLASLGLEMTALALLRDSKKERTALVLLALAFASSVVPWFGKPTFVLFTLGQLAVLAFDNVALRRRRRFVFALLGGACGAVPPLVYVLLRGDLRAWLRISLVDVPAMYRFIWPRTFLEIVRMPGYGAIVAAGAVAAALVIGLVVLRFMPRRALLLAVMPLAGLASVAIQGKGFEYHFHPVSAGTGLAAIAIVHEAWNRAERRGHALGMFAAGLLAIAFGVRARIVAESERYPVAPAAAQRDAASLVSAERLALSERVDFFPRGLRDAAAHLASHTSPDETVQTYGMDPYLLFLAQRRSATPYIYAYDLDADAALAGGLDQAPKPTEAQRRVITELRDAHERDLLVRLQAAPPAAFVFLDSSPLLAYADAETDFAEHCPLAYEWVRARYIESDSFEGIHIWLRLDAAR